MSQNVVILITGAPATGKTSLGRKLSHDFKLPFISKDAIKGYMFDDIGWSDKAWSLKVSAASHRIMDYIVEEELKAGHSIILESNFKKQIDSERFRKLQVKYGCELIQILCWAEGEVLFERFMSRINTSERHAGHVEAISPTEIKQGFIESGGRDTPIDIDGETIELETTHFDLVDYGPMYKVLEDALHD